MGRKTKENNGRIKENVSNVKKLIHKLLNEWWNRENFIKKSFSFFNFSLFFYVRMFWQELRSYWCLEFGNALTLVTFTVQMNPQFYCIANISIPTFELNFKLKFNFHPPKNKLIEITLANCQLTYFKSWDGFCSWCMFRSLIDGNF